MNIRRSVNLFGEVKIQDIIIKDGVETTVDVVVANFNASINNDTSYNINVNFTNKALIDSTESTKAYYENEYKVFEALVKAELE